MKEKPEKIRQILALNIKKRRESLGLTQERLAEGSNLSVQTINTIEGCRMWVSDRTITRIAKALKVEIFQLFVPYQTHRRELGKSSSSVLLELWQNIMSDVVNLNNYFGYQFSEPLKHPMQQQGEEEKTEQKQVHKRHGRVR